MYHTSEECFWRTLISLIGGDYRDANYGDLKFGDFSFITPRHRTTPPPHPQEKKR